MVPAYSPPDQPEPEKAHAALEDALSLYRTTTAEGLLDKLSLEPRIRAVQATLSHSETYQNAPVPVGTYDKQRAALQIIVEDVQETARMYNTQVPEGLREETGKYAGMLLGGLGGTLASAAALGVLSAPTEVATPRTSRRKKR